MRTPLIAANWKMNKTIAEAKQFMSDFEEMVRDVEGVEVVICPAFTALAAMKDIVGDKIKLGAQDMFFEEHGAFTGEVSPGMLKEVCDYVLIGHSERRLFFGETNDGVNKKIKAALKVGLKPIVCIGETSEERQHDNQFQVVEQQMKEGFAHLTRDEMYQLIIAYEPIWAISRGDPNHKAATAQDAQEMHHFIREKLNVLFGEDIMNSARIIYGGSAKPENIQELMAQPDIDGALPGNASLEPDSFSAVIHFN